MNADLSDEENALVEAMFEEDAVELLQMAGHQDERSTTRVSAERPWTAEEEAVWLKEVERRDREALRHGLPVWLLQDDARRDRRRARYAEREHQLRTSQQITTENEEGHRDGAPRT